MESDSLKLIIDFYMVWIVDNIYALAQISKRHTVEVPVLANNYVVVFLNLRFGIM